MSAIAATQVSRTRLRVPLARLQRAILWLFVVFGAVVIVEPSPYEAMFLLTAVLFAATGLKLGPALAPLIVVLLLFNLGGAFSLIPFLDEQASVTFVAVSAYMALTAVFFAALVAEDTDRRLDTIRSALIVSAWVAGLAGTLGYFDIAGLGEFFTRYSRASGSFKDPNVLGAYLVLPIVYIVQGLLVRRIGPLRAGLLISVPLLALFLSFSRGGWAHLVASLAILLALTFFTSRSIGARARVVLSATASAAVAAVALAAVLSIDAVRELFEIRASLDQDYDIGVTGRFGNQLRSLAMLIEMPGGFGPLQFRTRFGEDPHNVYLNAFASYGWLGGFSYILLILATWFVGWRTVFLRSPYQTHAIAIWSTLFVTTLQGVSIDTDHWRHFYLMLGLIWGLAFASMRTTDSRALPTNGRGASVLPASSVA